MEEVEKWQHLVCTLRSGIAKLPKPSEEELKRGLFRGVSGLFCSHEVGCALKWGSFTSLTTNLETAKDTFAHGKVVYEIQGIPEWAIGKLDHLSQYPNEYEVLMAPGLLFVVEEHTRQAGIEHYVKLRYIGPGATGASVRSSLPCVWCRLVRAVAAGYAPLALQLLQLPRFAEQVERCIDEPCGSIEDGSWRLIQPKVSLLQLALSKELLDLSRELLHRNSACFGSSNEAMAAKVLHDVCAGGSLQCAQALVAMLCNHLVVHVELEVRKRICCGILVDSGTVHTTVLAAAKATHNPGLIKLIENAVNSVDDPKSAITNSRLRAVSNLVIIANRFKAGILKPQELVTTEERAVGVGSGARDKATQFPDADEMISAYRRALFEFAQVQIVSQTDDKSKLASLRDSFYLALAGLPDQMYNEQMGAIFLLYEHGMKLLQMLSPFPSTCPGDVDLPEHAFTICLDFVGGMFNADDQERAGLKGLADQHLQKRLLGVLDAIAMWSERFDGKDQAQRLQSIREEAKKMELDQDESKKKVDLMMKAAETKRQRASACKKTYEANIDLWRRARDASQVSDDPTIAEEAKRFDRHKELQLLDMDIFNRSPMPFCIQEQAWIAYSAGLLRKTEVEGIWHVLHSSNVSGRALRFMKMLEDKMDSSGGTGAKP